MIFLPRSSLSPHIFTQLCNRGGHRNVPSIRPTSDALHALPSPSPLSPFFAPTCTSQTLPPSFPFYARDERTSFLSLSPSLSFSLFQQRLQETDTSLFQCSKSEFLSSIGSGCFFFFFFFFFQMTRSSFCERFKMRFLEVCFFLEVS